MNDRYVSIAIDHGTTNSCLAVMENSGPRIVNPTPTTTILPSAVYIDKSGRILKGEPARQAILGGAPGQGDGFTGYKLRIGQDHLYKFAAAGKQMTAPEMGSLIIGELLSAYRAESGKQPLAAVVTVPAKFNQADYEGTRKAARLAGLEYCPLLQEPIAAALAYGFNSSDDRAQWIVFDIGGGTLDVSLVMVRKGQLIVPDDGHHGDDKIGGSKLDRELMDYILGPRGSDSAALERHKMLDRDFCPLRKQFKLDSFTVDSNPQAWGRLTMAVEEAKISLSSRDEAVVEVSGVLCKDEAGRDVKVEVPIKRLVYEKLIHSDFERAIHCCRTLLEKNRLTAKEIDRIILIGGPSKTPYLRTMLADRLGIKLEYSIDPMTAVALGAAVHAGTIELPDEIRNSIVIPELQSGEVRVRMEYESFSRLTTYRIAGCVEGVGDKAKELKVEIKRSDGLWSSGQIPVDEDGVFATDVLLIDQGRPHLSEFKTLVTDQAGRVIASADEPKLWYPYTDTDGTIKLANSMLVAVRGNETIPLITQGQALPARGEQQFHTAKLIRRGSKEDVLRIPVMEAITNLLGAEDSGADSNVHVGTLTIEGSDERVTCDLPEGAEVDVTIEYNESREMHVRAYIPLLDDEFEAKFTSEKYQVTQDQVNTRFEGLKKTLAEIRELQARKPLESVQVAMQRFETMQVEAGLERDIERAREGDVDAFLRAYKTMLQLAGAVKQLRVLQMPKRIECRISDLEKVCKSDTAEDLSAIKAEFSEAAREQNADRMKKVEGSIDRLDVKLRGQPFMQLLLDVMALSGIRVNAHQKALFDEAAKLIEKLGEKGGIGSVTDDDINELNRMHIELEKAYPDLNERLKSKLEELQAQGKSLQDLGDLSDVKV